MPTIQTSLLEIAYKDDGPRDAHAVLLLHGWPDDSSTWDSIVPTLNNAGLRTITPTVRGFGKTRFLSPDTLRTGNTAKLVLDVIEMLDILGIQGFSVAGHDWGANMAEMLAVGWSGRVKRIAMLSTPPRRAGCLLRPSGTNGCNGISGFRRPSVVRRQCARIARGLPGSCGRHGRRRVGSTMSPSIEWRLHSTILTGSM
jgi:pimeloyl-ACP methyl ester carboxylesterase